MVLNSGVSLPYWNTGVGEPTQKGSDALHLQQPQYSVDEEKGEAQSVSAGWYQERHSGGKTSFMFAV